MVGVQTLTAHIFGGENGNDHDSKEFQVLSRIAEVTFWNEIAADDCQYLFNCLNANYIPGILDNY